MSGANEQHVAPHALTLTLSRRRGDRVDSPPSAGVSALRSSAENGKQGPLARATSGTGEGWGEGRQDPGTAQIIGVMWSPGNEFPGSVGPSRLKPTALRLAESPSGDFSSFQPGNSFPGVRPLCFL